MEIERNFSPGLPLEGILPEGSKLVLEVEAIERAWVLVQADHDPAQDVLLSPGERVPDAPDIPRPRSHPTKRRSRLPRYPQPTGSTHTGHVAPSAGEMGEAADECPVGDVSEDVHERGLRAVVEHQETGWLKKRGRGSACEG